MKVYLGYVAYPFGRGHEVVKAFDTEEKAKKWMTEENAKVFQEFDDYGLVDGEEYNFFELELE